MSIIHSLSVYTSTGNTKSSVCMQHVTSMAAFKGGEGANDPPRRALAP